MLRPTLLIALGATVASAFPWMANLRGIDLSLVERRQKYPTSTKRQIETDDKGSAEYCPVNPEHLGAAPFNPLYPYTGAVDGLPGTGIGGKQVPAPGDEAHYFTPPGSLDIRGPCPGMNTAANHNFLSHDGITSFAELMNAQQNLYNLDYPLALIIALRAIALVGDVTTLRLSIGCDATSRTSIDPSGSLGREPGLDGHNRFEADTSMTRTDFFFHGDDFTFNNTLFGDMYDKAQQYGGGLFNRDAIAAHRSQRWDDSFATNPNFYFGPKAVLLYSAASFTYQVFPGSSHQPDIDTVSSFFGAQDNGDGTWSHVPERIPENWSNRETPYGIAEIAAETAYQYFSYPKAFGGNAGVGNFLGLNSTFGIIQNGTIPSDATQADFICLLYQFMTENVPGEVQNEPGLALDVLEWIAKQINPYFVNYGCPIVYNS